ncbi:hypothetical protein CRYPA_1404 [uncultured Candidatus Thioglobus sp.]|nr:hypothetical protein CRYPA_1404 [uncultured Candidatus Thioglobus sp.]
MAHKKPIIIFTKDRDDLPFIIKKIDSEFADIRIYTYVDDEDIKQKFNDGMDVFSEQ